MRSILAEPFFHGWRELPGEIKTLARKNYRLWRENPRHGSLQFKEVLPKVWAVRIGLHYRALGRVHGDAIYWFWIGPHAEYDRILRRR